MKNLSLENSIYQQDRMSLGFNLKGKAFKGNITVLNVKHPNIKHVKGMGIICPPFP